MKWCFPVEFKTYQSGLVGAFFPDVPEAITRGTDTAEALRNAEDALVVALSGYLDDRRPIPEPTPPARGKPVVWLPVRVALKAAIHNAMIAEGITQAQLGERLGVDGRQVRRLLDLDHESRLNHLVDAMAALGLRATVGIEKAPITTYRVPATKAA